MADSGHAHQIFPWKIKFLLLAGVLGVTLTACAPPPAPELTSEVNPPPPTELPIARASETSTEAPQVIGPPEMIPAVDTSLHSVPLDRIFFDTFRPVNRAVPLSRAAPEMIDDLRDAIPPIHQPDYVSGREAAWLSSDDIVLGYAAGGEAWAYPIRILNFHEIVNDVLAGEPVLISYCPLCYSGIVYSRSLGEQVLTFGNTGALYESDMVMLDYETGSYWWQVAGKAIVGPLTDRTLTTLPSSLTTWEGWFSRHPDTLVLSRDTGFGVDYGRNPFLGIGENFNRGTFTFPVSEAALDDRLKPAEIVLAFEVGDQVYGLPLGGSDSGVFNMDNKNVPIVVFFAPEGPSGAVYLSIFDGETLKFVLRDGAVVDENTGTTWDFAGRGTSGELKGALLSPVASKTTFWYAIVAAEPDIELLTTE